MKKLMIGAAVAALATGAFAGLCDIQGDDSTCEAYDVTVTLKTLTHKILKCKETCTTGADCVPYYVNGNRKFKGILWMCEADCSFEDAQLVLWRTDKGYNYAIGDVVWPDLTVMEYKCLDFRNQLLGLVNRYDKKAGKVQMAWSIPGLQECWWDSQSKTVRNDEKKTGLDLPDYSLALAGFGSYDTKNLRVKSISGGVAGTVGADPTGSKCVYDYGFLVSTCVEFVDYCEGDGDIDASPDSTAQGILSGDESALAAYGTWKLKYNKKYSTGNQSIVSYVPNYAK